MAGARDVARQNPDGLPEGCSLHGIRCPVDVRQSIGEGRRDVEAGRAVLRELLPARYRMVYEVLAE